MSILAALIPVISWVLLNTATGILLTVPLPYRLYFLPAILVPAIISFKTIQYLTIPPGLSELWGTITLIGFAHFSSLLYLKKWTLRSMTSQIDKTECHESNSHWLKRYSWKHMYKIATNPRFVRVPYKNVILPKSKNDAGIQVKSSAVHDKFHPTRVLRLLIKIGIIRGFNHFTTTRLLGPISVDDFVPAKAVLLRRLLPSMLTELAEGSVTKREIVLRIWFTVNSMWVPILLLDTIHTALAIFFIYIIRIDMPEEWPDLFGSPSEAYTLGRFWSRFWHRVHLSGYSDYADLFINILPRRVLQNAAIKRAIKTCTLFMMSGLIHHFTNLQLNPRNCRDSADIQFFCVNAVFVISESALLHQLTGSPPETCVKDNRPHQPGLGDVSRRVGNIVVCIMGYLWVIGFFIWAVPGFYNQRVYCTILDQQVRSVMLPKAIANDHKI